MVKGASGQLPSTRKIVSLSARSVRLRQEHVHMRSREIVLQARMECSQQAETRSRRKTSTAMERVGA